MRLVVLAGGFGTRLKSVVADVPKPLAPVSGVPFLKFQLANWRDQGVNKFTFLLHYQAGLIISFLQAQQSDLLNGCQVDWLIEPKPMNTGGAIARAVQTLNLHEDFLVTNADTWLGGGVHELMHICAPAMAVVNLADVTRYGYVYFDSGNRVTAFVEKNPQHSDGWVNAGLYHLDAEIFSEWDGQPFSLERDLFPALVRSRCIAAVPLQTDFVDIGVPEDYCRFCRWIEADRQIPLCN